MKIVLILATAMIVLCPAIGVLGEEIVLSKWLDEDNWPEGVRYASAIKIAPDTPAAMKALQEYHNAKLTEVHYSYNLWMQGAQRFCDLKDSVDELFEIRMEMAAADANQADLLEAKLEFAELLESQADVIAMQRPRGTRYQNTNVEMQQKSAVAFHHQVKVEILRARGEIPARQ